MIPTREQFRDFIAAIKRAQEKEEKVNEAFKLIWDDEQEYNISDIDVFYDYLVEKAKESDNKARE